MTYARDARVRELAAAFGGDQAEQNAAILLTQQAAFPFANYAAVLDAPKPDGLARVSAIVDGRQVDWVRRGGPFLGGGWDPAGPVTPQHAGEGDLGARVQAAIDYVGGKGGGEVIIPSGTYTQTTVIEMASGVTVRCDDGVVIDANTVSLPIRWTGTFGAQVALTAASTRGDVTITVADASGIAPGDYVQMISQRNCLAPEAGTNWRLGVGTAGLPEAWFAEWHVIQSMAGNVLTFPEMIVFPDYRPDATLDPNTTRTSATIRKANPVINAHWIGGRIIHNTRTDHVAVMYCAIDCTIVGSLIEKWAARGSAVEIRTSYNCEAVGVECLNDPKRLFEVETDHFYYNRFKTMAAQGCGFKSCHSDFAAQTFDLTYAATDGFNVANLDSYVIGCRTRGAYEGATSHPGCYGEVWKDNQFLDCAENGLFIRGRAWTATGNIITAQSDRYGFRASPLGYGPTGGIRLSGPGARSGMASGNTFIGFRSMLMVHDNSPAQGLWDTVDVKFSENSGVNCYYGLLTRFEASNAFGGLRNIEFSNNTLFGDVRGLAYLSQGSAGTDILENTVNGDLYQGGSAYVALVETEENNPFLRVEGNKWNRTKGGNAGAGTKYDMFIRAVTDGTRYPEALFKDRTIIKGNDVRYGLEDGITRGIGGVADVYRQAVPLLFSETTNPVGNDNVVRLPDGTQMCWAIYFHDSTSTAAGTKAFPAPFMAGTTPSVSVGYGSTLSLDRIPDMKNIVVGADAANWYIRTDVAGTNTDMRLTLFAIGRWK